MSTSDHRQALDLAREGRWDEAHRIVQQLGDPMSCAIHGYLHRVEGDESNAGYWYRRAGKAAVTDSLEEEWQALDLQVKEATEVLTGDSVNR